MVADHAGSDGGTIAAPDGAESRTVAADLTIAGRLFVVSGLLLAGVMTYFYVVLIRLGLSIDLLDDPDGMLAWLESRSGAYSVMFLIQLGQQMALAGAVVAVGRAWRKRSTTDRFTSDAACVFGLISVTLAAVSIAILVLAAQGAVAIAPSVVGPEQRFSLVTSYALASDLGKGARLVSEPFLGIWLIWFGWAARTAFGSKRWWALCALGIWTAIVGIWKLIEPTMPFEDWIAFPLSIGFIATGIALSGRRFRGY